MSDTSANLGLPYIMPSQAQKHVTHNEAIRSLDALTQLAVISRDFTDPPAAPAEGDRYIVAAGGGGIWAGHDGEIAAYQDGTWMFYAPLAGWIAHINGDGALAVFDGADWTDVDAGLTLLDLENVPRLGVNAAPDAVNRLAVASAATLFSHDGNGHQMKINKAAAADTASLLLQTNWSGRAEMGTAGSDDFAVKVSADGTNWSEALTIDAASAEVSFSADVDTPGDMRARRFLASCADFEYLVTSIENDHVTPKSSTFEFSFNGTRRYAFGANQNNGNFNITAFAADGSWKGSPLTIEYAGTASLQNALYIDAESNVGIGKVPGVNLDVNGIMRLSPKTKATLPAATTAGAGALAFVSDAAGGAQLAYCDGAAWLKVRDGLAV